MSEITTSREAIASKNLKGLLEEDISKIFGEPVHNHHLLLCMFTDFLLVQLLLGPANCFVWIGVWEIMDILIPPTFINGFICFASGIFLAVVLVVVSDSLLIISQALYKYNKLIFFLATRLYSFLTCLVMILFWKGWFDIWQHEDENKMLRKHWDLSLCCLLIGSLLLSSLGCLKSAAVTPPLGVWLDRGVDYVRVDKFYSAPENKEDNGCWVFRLKNAGLTVLIEVLCLITYFGAWCVVDDLLCHQEFINQLLPAVFCSVLSYLLSVLYLYLHHCSS